MRHHYRWIPFRCSSRADTAHAETHRQRTALRATAEALEAVAGQGLDGNGDGDGTGGSAPHSDLRIGEVAARLGLRPSTLLVWEEHGLLVLSRIPGTTHRGYGPADVRDARMVLMLRQGGYRLAQIRPVLEGLRATGSTEELRAAVTRRHAELARRTAAMLASAVHLHRYLSEPDPG